MNSLKRISVLWPALCILYLSFAVAGDQNRVGTSGGQELLIPVGARGIGVGGSSLSYAQGVDAIYWNPAGLSLMNSSTEVTFSQVQYIADIGVTYGAIGVKAGSIGTIGVSIKSVQFGNIPVTTELQPDGTGETYSPTFMNIGLTYSNQWSDKVAFGFTASLLSEQIRSSSASAVTFSGGIQYLGLGLHGLNLGVAVRNVGSSLTFNGSNLLASATIAGSNRPASYLEVTTAAAELPTTIEVGLSYLAKFDAKSTLTVSGSFQNNNFSDDEWKLGAEFCFEDLLFLRGGYTLAPTAGTDPLTGSDLYQYDYTLGVGVKVDLGGTAVMFDYGYRHELLFTANNVFTVTLGF
jgi:hypothetical protein